MAHTVYLGSFTKKLNSTAQPNYSGWSSYSCDFKEETSLYSPTLRLSANWASLASANYNYAVMQSRYYWIRDIRAIRTNYVEVDLQLDPLATYKSRITATSAFIEYGFNSFDASADSYRFIDSRIPVSENPVMYDAFIDPSGGAISPQTGCYIVQAVGNNPNGSHKGLATFVLTAGELARLMNTVNTNIVSDINDILANPNALTPQELANQLWGFDLRNELLNESALAAVQSVTWLPLDPQYAQGTPTELFLGNYGTGITAPMLSTNYIYRSINSLAIPWPVTDWKRNNCQVQLYIPFFGTVPIAVDQCVDSASLSITWSAEYFSGSISVKVDAGTMTVYTGSTNISVNMGVGRSQVGTSQAIGGAIQALGGVIQMAGGALDMSAGTIGSLIGMSHFAEGAGAIASGMQSTYQGYVQTVQPMITCAGTMGGMAAIAQIQLARVVVLYYAPIDESGFSAKYGHPVFRIGTPAGGFCKTRGFSVSGPMPGSYAAVINSAMDGGVYIE